MPASSRKIVTLGDLLHWSYANLALAESVAQRGVDRPDKLSWMIRARLFKGLQTGTMTIGSLFAEARELRRDECAYCGARPQSSPHADHLIPRYRRGLESADNLVWACRSCNSSKGPKDLLEWYALKKAFPSFALMRRYLKLAILEAQTKRLMDVPLVESPNVTFLNEFIPTSYPTPDEPMVIERRQSAASRS